MFKPGDKIIAIVKNTRIDISLNKEYTVQYYSPQYEMLTLVETSFIYYVNKNKPCFISLKEHRKQKLNKLKTTITKEDYH